MTMISGLVNPDIYNRNNKDPDWIWLFIIIGLCFLTWFIGKVIISPILLALGPIGVFITGIIIVWLIYDLLKDLIHMIRKWFNI